MSERDEETTEEVEEVVEEPDYKSKAEELESKLNEANEELEKLKKKDTNFNNVKKQTEEEKKKFENEKKTLSEKVKELQEQIDANSKRQVDDWFESAVSVVTNGDKKTADEIRKEYSLLNMPTTTREEVMARMNKAMKLAGVEVGGDLNAITFGSGREPQRKEKRFTDTQKGKDIYNMLAPDLAKKDNE